MNRIIEVSIEGLGFIIYSPFAVAHIREGEDYLSNSFWKPDDVARHVRACTIAAFCTGTPGDFVLEVSDDPAGWAQINSTEFCISLGVEVRDQQMCIRDLYDLMEWSPNCPPDQRLSVENGFYRLGVHTSRPPSGIFGDNQRIGIVLERLSEAPNLDWQTVPLLC